MLEAQLRQRGRAVSARALVDWRQKGLLPQLQSRGRGRGRGKHNYWRSPKIIDQAILIGELMELNFPNDEALIIIWLLGFSVKPDRVRDAWLSRLKKLENKLDLERKKIIEDQEVGFIATEDEFSALTAKYARKLAEHFGFDLDQSAEILINLFGLIFKLGYVPDIDFLSGLAALVAPVLTMPPDQLEMILAKDFNATIKFVRDRMSFPAVYRSVALASNVNLTHAHRRWRTLLKFAPHVLPEAAGDKASKFALAGFGRLIMPVIAEFIRGGQTRQIDQTIAAIAELITRTDLAGIIGVLLRRNNIGPMDQIAVGYVSAALQNLGNIWRHRGFPFAVTLPK